MLAIGVETFIKNSESDTYIAAICNQENKIVRIIVRDIGKKSQFKLNHSSESQNTLNN